MTFQSPSSPDEEPSREPDDAGAVLPPSATPPTPGAPAWATPPAAADATSERPAGTATMEPEEPHDVVTASHGGLAEVDPWGPVAPAGWRHAIWPWGLGGVVETLDVVILALAMFLCVRFVAHNYIVDGASMVPTFEDSDFLIVNRLAYRSFDLSWIPGVDEDEWRPFGHPEQGDIVVFAFRDTGRDFIKRVIAVEGQTVQVTGGVVYVDGVPLDEPYLAQPPNYELPPTTVEPGMLFVLGDNRNNSFDSHSFGPIEESSLVGRADLRYWPLARWGLVEHMIGTGQQGLASALRGLAAAWR